MSADAYLHSLVQKYAVNADGAKAAGNKIYPVLQKWSNGYLNKAEFSGSLSKEGLNNSLIVSDNTATNRG